jgi:hypothetical protein
MSVRAYYDVWCDGEDCDHWAEWATSYTLKAARQRAVEGGWTYKRGVGDLCPDCQEKAAA